jgi:hypothetical protein
MTPAMSNHPTNNAHHQRHGTTVATTTTTKDAALLMETMGDESATMGLHRSNLMRLQVTELLQECQIPELAQTSWALDSHEYLVQLTDLVQQLPSFQYSSTSSSPSSSTSSSSSKRLLQQRSDKPVVVSYTAAADDAPPSPPPSHKKNSSHTPTPKNHSLSSSATHRGGTVVVEPIGCTKTPVAWTKPTGNAKLLPTFTLMVQLPTSSFAAKDYLNYRYMDVSGVGWLFLSSRPPSHCFSFLLVFHCAFLSHAVFFFFVFFQCSDPLLSLLVLQIELPYYSETECLYSSSRTTFGATF